MKKKIYLLHGFLGQVSDWTALAKQLEAETDFSADPIDLYGEFAALPTGAGRSLEGWSRAFVARAERDARECGVRPAILGYSMGGRLALHALLEAPSAYSGAILVSAHPGLRTPTEKAARLESDSRWSERFLQSDWETILAEWNAQAVLATSQEVDRSAQEPRRGVIAQSLRDWSLGQQRDLRPDLRKLCSPVLWMAGEKDSRYISLLKEVAAEGPATETRVVPGAGHRIPWDRAEAFGEAVCGFLSRLE